MLLSDYNFDLLPVHTVVDVQTDTGQVFRLMWRGYGRFTNLTTGSEWFVADSQSVIVRIDVPAFTIGG